MEKMDKLCAVQNKFNAQAAIPKLSQASKNTFSCNNTDVS